GLGTASRGFTGFGTAWVDIDNDGWLDLLLVNGAVKHIEELARAGDPFPLDERDQVFLNLGDGSFAERSRVAGPAFELSEVGRGAAFGDLDNDGDTDVVVANNSGPLRLLLNLVGQRNRWVGVRMTDPEGRYDVIGTEVSLRLEDGRSLVRRVRTAASYLSSNDPRVLFGLGGASGVVSLRAVWPDGTIEDWEAPAIGRYTGIERGSGRVAAR
ncbi:MAG TPA: CRTAC1 family protein, partial [Candidatus Polarisedimenticolaceae bacterium]|nr:CRTAC1 family protein [Candidatus Polarisedimenticolaceae bacterium]